MKVCANTEKQQIEDEICFNEAMDRQRKGENKYFKAIFQRNNPEMVSVSGLNTIETNDRQSEKKAVQFKRVLLIMSILALTLTIVLIIRRIQLIENSVNSVSSPENIIRNNSVISPEKLILDNEHKNELEIEMNHKTDETTELTTMTYTLETTTIKEIDYILATVIVNRATVPEKDHTFISKGTDAYVVLFYDNLKFGSTNFIANNNNPEWNHHFVHQIKLSTHSTIKFEIYDHERYTKDEFIGSLTVEVSTLINEGLNGKITSRKYGSGSLWFTVSWVEIYKS